MNDDHLLANSSSDDILVESNGLLVESDCLARFDLTNRSMNVINSTLEQAQTEGNRIVNTGHLLLALIKGSGGDIASTVLESFEFEDDEIHRSMKQVGFLCHDLDSGNLSLAIEMEAVLKQSHEEMINLSHHRIGPEHLLLGLLNAKNCLAHKVLNKLNCKVAVVQEAVLDLIGTSNICIGKEAQENLKKIQEATGVNTLEEAAVIAFKAYVDNLPES